VKEGLSEELLVLFLPDGILDYFTIVSYTKSTRGKRIYKQQLELTLEEKILYLPNINLITTSLVALWILGLFMIIRYAIC